MGFPTVPRPGRRGGWNREVGAGGPGETERRVNVRGCAVKKNRKSDSAIFLLKGFYLTSRPGLENDCSL